jgi:hypothetical protein
MPFDALTFEPVLPAVAVEAAVDPYWRCRARGIDVERLVWLRDFLARLPAENFDMGDFGPARRWKPAEYYLEHRCRTPACIAGWASVLFGGRVGEDPGDVAERVLRLNGDDADDLFLGYDHHTTYTPADAVKVLDHLLATGEVRWDVVP